jgi:peptide/nickel transport system substrate-binding protein
VGFGATLLLQACGGGAPAPPTAAPAPAQPQAIPTPTKEQAAAASPTAAVTATTAPAATQVPVATTAPTVAVSPTTASQAQAARTNVPRNQTLIIGYEGGVVEAPELHNPYAPGAPLSQGNHQLMIESLYYLNYETGQAMPWQAESHQFNADYTQVDIKLRDGVEWSDGTPFTANDVVFTLQTLHDNPTLGYGPEMGRWIKDVSVLDSDSSKPLKVRVNLTGPYPRFIFNNFTVHIWGAVRILPQHIWKGQDPLKFTNYDPAKGWPVWTGPYRLVKAGPSEFDFDRRDDWWAAKIGFAPLPAPLRVVMVEAGTDDKKAAAIQNNDVDGEPSLQIDSFLKVKQQNAQAIGWLDQPPYSWIDPCPATLGFNNEVAPWDNPTMRWAVNLAIDKKKLGDAFGFGYGLPARYNFPFYTPLEAMLNDNNDLFQKYNVLEYNPQKAMQMIEGVGYKKGNDGVYAKDGKRLTANILVKSEMLTLPSVSLITSFFKGIGIDATPQGLADTQYFDKRNRADYEIETTHVACGSVVDPFAEVNLFHSQWIMPKGQIRSNNIWGYKNPDYDKQVDKIGAVAPGDPSIKPAFRQALEYRLRDLPMIALDQQYRVVPYTTKYWTNWPTVKNDYIHPPNWWMTFLIPLTKIKPAGG